jgi:hypothetical protein
VPAEGVFLPTALQTMPVVNNFGTIYLDNYRENIIFAA